MRQVAASIINDPFSENLFSHVESSDRAVSLRLPILGSAVVVRIVRDSTQGFLVGVHGLSDESTQWLNEVAVVKTKVVITDDSKFLQVFAETANLAEVQDLAVKCAKQILSFRTQEEAGAYSADVTVPMYWASETFNFGDWVGPHLISAYTGRQPVHMRRLRGNARRTLFSVGSILGVLRRNDVDVWGSGLIKPLTSDEIRAKKSLSGIRIHAVRGELTQNALQDQLGWNVPEVYGDPALLLPEVLPWNQVADHAVTCIPHYVHRKSMRNDSPDNVLCDVRTDVTIVARQVASAEAVVSSSLHGLILAQAYGIPWVRLKITDRPLTGGDFKFDDFYSGLAKGSVSTVETTLEKLPDLEIARVASEANLPEMNIDLSILRNSLPVKVANRPYQFL